MKHLGGLLLLLGPLQDPGRGEAAPFGRKATALGLGGLEVNALHALRAAPPAPKVVGHQHPLLHHQAARGRHLGLLHGLAGAPVGKSLLRANVLGPPLLRRKASALLLLPLLRLLRLLRLLEAGVLLRAAERVRGWAGRHARGSRCFGAVEAEDTHFI